MQPIDQVEMIRRSQRCFVCGVIGFLPVIGLPFAVVALGDYVHVSQLKGPHPNPLQRYVRWGAYGSIAGLLLTVFLGALVAVQLWWGR